jgi:inosine/guanosine/xanthosine phosphorylase family protein
MIDERLAHIRHAAHELEAMSGGLMPRALVVLGSGLGDVVDAMTVTAEASFADLPGYAAAGVVGHAGKFVFGTLGGTPVLAMLGRIHLYEGHPADQVVLPVRAAAMLGCEVLIATNAAGGVAPRLRVGQTMMITDHVNLTGANPLTGPNIDELGVRFPPMADAYSERLAVIAREVADGLGADMAEGVYAAVPGPNYETRAEIRYLHAIGADAVGMSTVPEVIAARHCGMEVAAFSLIANVAGEMTDSHEHVLTAVEEGAPVMASVVAGILSRL